MTVLLLGAAIIGNPLSIDNPYERTPEERMVETVGLDENGWPQDFWANLGTMDEDFSLGDRHAPHERSDPVKGD